MSEKEFKELREKIKLQENWLLKNSDNPKVEEYLIKFNETLDKFNKCMLDLEKSMDITISDKEMEEGKICSYI